MGKGRACISIFKISRPLGNGTAIFCKKIIYIYVSYFVTDSGGHPLGGSIQCGSKRRVALQFVIASVTSSVITLRARCQGNSCNCPGLGTRIPHATFDTIYYICHLLYNIPYMPHCIHYTICQLLYILILCILHSTFYIYRCIHYIIPHMRPTI